MAQFDSRSSYCTPLAKFGYGPTPAKYLNTLVRWDRSGVPSARARSKCQLMDSAVKTLDICSKGRNEFTHPRYGCGCFVRKPDRTSLNAVSCRSGYLDISIPGMLPIPEWGCGLPNVTLTASACRPCSLWPQPPYSRQPSGPSVTREHRSS